MDGPCGYSRPDGFRSSRVRKQIGDASLRNAVERAEMGLVDADLGGHIIKQRIARPGQGRSGGYRVVIALRYGDRAIFVFGFAKSERDNIDDNQLKTLQSIAVDWLVLSDAGVERAIAEERLQEI